MWSCHLDSISVYFKFYPTHISARLFISSTLCLDWKPEVEDLASTYGGSGGSEIADSQENFTFRVLNRSVPFEMHVYDAIFTTVKVLQSQQFERINKYTLELLSYTKQGSLFPVELQEEFRAMKNAVSQMKARMESYRRALTYVIENDVDMALMNLTMLKKNPELYRCVL